MKPTLALAILTLTATAAYAQTSREPTAASQVSENPAAAAMGSYNVDGRHASVIARISHLGASLSVFRFNTITGKLDWTPADPARSKVTIEIPTTSITSNVPGFGEELTKAPWFNSAKYPTATFASTAIRTTGPTTGVITGNLTLMGVTKPVDITARMIGAGKNTKGEAIVGFSGTTRFKRSDFGFKTGLPMIGDDIELLIDVEFLAKAPTP
jgi:polyisoprenoid-binding protein YceI